MGGRRGGGEAIAGQYGTVMCALVRQAFTGQALSSCAFVELVFHKAYNGLDPWIVLYSPPLGDGKDAYPGFFRIAKGFHGLQSGTMPAPDGAPVVLYYIPAPYTAPTAASPPCGYPGTVPESRWFELSRDNTDPQSFVISPSYPNVRQCPCVRRRLAWRSGWSMG
jgi:hypothetical protein